ncbi:uncharacterized protein LOC114575617 [Exaiptasia diaphana]|uniref:Uncharacterized protein n=1 Tax=Exaiptasia diaphana TaxID=2652724 RepID=A0A913YNR6_EXADI|nr:uncharacterized protein LOC114575617 [Exaiptasia diaphana]
MINMKKAFLSFKPSNNLQVQNPLQPNGLAVSPFQPNNTLHTVQNSCQGSNSLLGEMFPDIPQSTIDMMLDASGSVENVVEQLVDVPSSNMQGMLTANNSASQAELCAQSTPACSTMQHQQAAVSCNEDVTRLNVLFPNRVGDIPNIYGALNYDFKATIDFLLPDSNNTNVISFSNNTVPDIQGPSNSCSLNLSQPLMQRGSSVSTADAPGRRPQRCEYCGNEWPSLNGNNYCSYCGMHKKRFRYWSGLVEPETYKGLKRIAPIHFFTTKRQNIQSSLNI